MEEGQVWRREKAPSPEESRKLLTQRIGLTAGLLRSLEKDMDWEELKGKLAIPEAWKESAWLRGQHLLLLDESMSVRLGGLRLKYDQESGLSWQKEEDGT